MWGVCGGVRARACLRWIEERFPMGFSLFRVENTGLGSLKGIVAGGGALVEMLQCCQSKTELTSDLGILTSLFR